MFIRSVDTGSKGCVHKVWIQEVRGVFIRSLDTGSKGCVHKECGYRK